ncbi:DUF2141 domain-containing protein [Pseudochryseolinea flava]|uniref:DUF2141 domain-containing protein n=1 Tax=Pseudochryseolinea flava TaxID=2059302 RepID=A0A364XZB3_9BACT|nr:DUF2141 domain-containing protein [Pseudochryseolinea flava]RAV99345.1 hypothetical protein DQQ10_19145 [Pseudochryseolinea flava]
MKKIILLLAVLTSLTIVSKAQSSIEVTIKEIRAVKGSIRVAIYNNDESFLKTPLDGKIVKVASTEAVVVFENLKPGEYAISVVHDENDNGELDKNMMGIPKEGFAFGNNATGMFGPPDFSKAKVKVDGAKVNQVINLNYM